MPAKPVNQIGKTQ